MSDRDDRGERAAGHGVAVAVGPRRAAAADLDVEDDAGEGEGMAAAGAGTADGMTVDAGLDERGDLEGDQVGDLAVARVAGVPGTGGIVDVANPGEDFGNDGDGARGDVEA